MHGCTPCTCAFKCCSLLFGYWQFVHALPCFPEFGFLELLMLDASLADHMADQLHLDMLVSALLYV